MPIEWLPDALDRLTGDVEPYEVSQVLNSRLRRPVPVTRHGVRLLTIWGRRRTANGGRAAAAAWQQGRLDPGDDRRRGCRAQGMGGGPG